MATRQYDIARAESHFEVGEQAGGAITDAVRVTIDLAQIADRDEAVLLIDKIRMHVLEAVWPPA
ncbi:MAG: hypothetical protein GY791_08335 [Alphaproteobacteria bacterium]|nr:hypothetical protein [Alphaproteobacteria bacterium]